MTRWKRLLYYLVINVIVSASTMLAVLILWDKLHPGNEIKPQLAQLNPLNQTATITPLITLPSETPTLKPTQSVQAYTVQEGETLGEIAMRFDISMDDLIELNGIGDPDNVGAGTVILVPKGNNIKEEQMREGGIPPTVTPAPGDTNGFIMIDRVVGAGDFRTEFVLVRGTGSGEISLKGWTLEDDDGNRFVFPQLTLFQDGAVAVHTASGMDTVVDLYWDLDHAVWDSGDPVILSDANGNVRATYRVP